MKQTNHALTFLHAHYRAIFLRAWRSGCAWASVATVALASAVAAQPEGAADAPAAADLSAAGAAVAADGAADAASFIQVAPDCPIVHVPNLVAAEQSLGGSAAPKFFDLAQDGSPLSQDVELNGNVLVPSDARTRALRTGSSVFERWSLVSDATKEQPRSAIAPALAPAFAPTFEPALDPAGDPAGTALSDASAAVDAWGKSAPALASDAAAAGGTRVVVGADGAVTLTDRHGALMALRPNDAQPHRYSLVVGNYELELTPDTTVELTSGTSLSLDGMSAISINAEGALALDWAALGGYDLTLSESMAANLVVDVTALGQLEQPGLLKLGGTALALESDLEQELAAPTNVHAYQFPQAAADFEVSSLLPSALPPDDEAQARAKLSIASAAAQGQGLTVTAPLGGARVGMAVEQAQELAHEHSLLDLAAPEATAPGADEAERAVLDLGSLSALAQGSADVFAVDLKLGRGSTLVLADQSPAVNERAPELAMAHRAAVASDAVAADAVAANEFVALNRTRHGRSVFAAPQLAPARIALEVTDPEAQSEYIALTYQNGAATQVKSPDQIKFVLDSSTPVLLDVSELGPGTVAIDAGADAALPGRPEVVLARDESSGLLAVNGADLALPLMSTGRVDVAALLEASAGGIGSAAVDTSKQVLSGIEASDQIAGDWAALEVATSANPDAPANPDPVQVTAGETLALHGTKNSWGESSLGESSLEAQLAPLAATTQGQMVGIELGAGSSLNLKGSGKIGSLTGRGTVNLNGVNLMVVTPDGAAPDNIDVKALKLKDSKLKAKELKAKHFESLSSALHLESLKVSDDGSFSAKDSELKLKVLDVSTVRGSADLAASQVEVGTVLGNQMAVHQGTSVYAENITLRGLESVLAVGHNPASGAADAAAVAAASAAPVAERSVSGSVVVPELKRSKSDQVAVQAQAEDAHQREPLAAYTPIISSVVAGQIDLQGGLLWLNAPHGERATVQTPQLGPTSAADIMKLSGNVVVGRNAALGLTDDTAGFAQAQQLVLREDEDLAAVPNAAVLNADVSNTAAEGEVRIGVSSLAYIDRAGIDLGSYKLIVGPESSAVLQRELSGSNSIYLGAHAGMQVTARALGQAAARADSVFVNMEHQTVASNGGYLLLPAMTTASELGSVFGTKVKLKDGDTINVATENGLYRGTITTSAQLQGKSEFDFKLAPNSRQILRKLSNPTYDAVMNIMSPDSSFIGTYERQDGTALDSIINNYSDSWNDIANSLPNGTVDGTLSPDDSSGLTSNDTSNSIAGPVTSPSLGDDLTAANDSNSISDTTSGTSSSLGESLDGSTGQSTTGSTGQSNGSMVAIDGSGSGTGSSSSGSAATDVGDSLRPSNGVRIDPKGVGFQFLRDALGSNSYEAIDRVARMANFGGAVQGVQLVSASSLDAMNLRLGFGKGANMELSSGIARSSSLANNSLWLNPIYRNYKAKNYDAQGREYGSDIELYGAILGLDHYERGDGSWLLGSGLEGLRLGAMFSVGEGDAQGKNAGQGISNDISFYSLGLFAGLDLGREVKLVADLSYAEVKNELSSFAGVQDWNLMTSSTHSSNFNVGVGAQVTVQAPKSHVEISPHLSLRYQHISLDDYGVAIDGTTVAYNEVESMNMWSLPLGVSFARDFSTAQWLVRPALDLTLSANFGDTDMNSSTRFVGIRGGDFNYCTQVIDDFTYSITTGLALKHSSGQFAAFLNVGYNGSSHSEDYLVNAQLNYLF